MPDAARNPVVSLAHFLGPEAWRERWQAEWGLRSEDAMEDDDLDDLASLLGSP